MIYRDGILQQRSIKMNIKSLNLTDIHLRSDPFLTDAAAGLAAFAASAGFTGGCRSMLGAGLAALFPSTSVWIFIASAAGYIMFSSVSEGMIQLCAIVLTAVFRGAFFHGGRRDSPIFLAALTSGILLACSLAFSAVMPSPTEEITLRAVSSLITGCFVYSFGSLAEHRRLDRTLPVGGTNSLLTSVVYICSVAVLSSIGTPVLNIGRAVGCFCVLCMARRYRMTGGAASGALTSCAVLLGAPYAAKSTLILSTAGLICGAFTELGVFAVCLSFIAVSAVGLATLGGSDASLMFIDAAAASAVFAAMPQGVIRKLLSSLFCGTEPSDALSRSTSARLGFVSSTLAEIRSQLNLASAAMERTSSRRSIASEVFSSMCASCDNRCICHRDADLSAERLGILERIAMQYNGVSESDVRLHLPECCSPDLVSDCFNYSYRALLAGKAERLRIGDMRSLVSEQLSSMEDIIADLSDRVGRIRSIDRPMSERVRDHFERIGCTNARVCVYLDEAGFRHTEVFLSSMPPCEPIKLALDISDIIDCMLDLPVITRTDSVVRLLFTELPVYELESGDFSASAENDGCSGDTFELLRITPCECYAILSDGMGTGKRARLDSMFAVSLASKLLTAGISMRSVLRLINTMLKAKGWDESFATVDIMRIDLCAGTAELLKAGAAPTYLLRDGAIRRFGGQALPAGILAGCSPDLFSFKLFDGDMLIMTTDGVTEQQIRQAAASDEFSQSVNSAARAIGKLAVSQSVTDRKDDITAAVFRVFSKNDR